MAKKGKSYLGNPYANSNRQARIYSSAKSAVGALRRKKKPGTIYQVGSGRHYVIRLKGQKYYSK